MKKACYCSDVFRRCECLSSIQRWPFGYLSSILISCAVGRIYCSHRSFRRTISLLFPAWVKNCFTLSYVQYVKYFFDKHFKRPQNVNMMHVCMYVCMYQYYLYSYLVLRPRDFHRLQSLKDPIVHPRGPSTAIYGSSRRADALENTCSSFQCDG
jgi:hypothetical protein